MWAVILLLCVLIFSVVALLAAYFDLRDTVKFMQSTIDMQNERYDSCLKDWHESIKTSKEVLKSNEDIYELNERCINSLTHSEELIKNFDNRINSVEKDLNTRMDSISETLLRLMEPSEDEQDEKEEG